MTEMVASLLKLQTLDNDVAVGGADLTPYRRRKRRELLQNVPEAALRNYDRLRRRHADAVVPVIDGVCMGCYVQLPASVRVRLNGSNRDQVCCDHCGRLLYVPDAE